VTVYQRIAVTEICLILIINENSSGKIIILLIFSIILYPIIKNNNYQKKLLNNIYENTDLKDIKYLNKDNNYFIIKTKDKVIVLDLNHEEVYSISTSEIKMGNLDLSYTRNNLYYKERIRKNNKLTYKYYDIKTNEEVFTSVLGGSNE